MLKSWFKLSQLSTLHGTMTRNYLNNWSKNFDERTQCHLVTPRGDKWIRVILIPCNTWFLGLK